MENRIKTLKQAIILSKSHSLSREWKTEPNNNVLVLGATGSRKTFNVVVPNILQACGSYVITDPGGFLYKRYSRFLKSRGYKVRKLDLSNIKESWHYNPFRYLRNEYDIRYLAKALLSHWKNQYNNTGFDYIDSERLLTAIVTFFCTHPDINRRNLAEVGLLLNQEIFTKTKYARMVSLAVALMELNEKGALTVTDNIDLDSIDDGRTALFICPRTQDDNINVLATVMLTQLIRRISDQCEEKDHNEPVTFIFDEFANVGRIPDFYVKTAHLIRFRCSFIILAQSITQLQRLYGKEYDESYPEWKNIVSGCDTILFTGGRTDSATATWMTEQCGGGIPAHFTCLKTRIASGKIIINTCRKKTVTDTLYNTKKHPNWKDAEAAFKEDAT